ncbi:MAG: CDP-diacylglycerol--serine O-phosphatidyltransferase [Bdellovibrionales bacterium]
MPHFPEHLAFKRLLPNILTLLALASGLTALRYGLLGHYEKTVIAMLAAGFFDIMDGRVARMLGTPSKFGAELDSLSDVICFGVTPAITMYLWTLSGAGTLGWLAVLCFVLCCALRLARFNVMAEDPNPKPFTKKFFTGVPTPAGGALAMMPLVADIQWPELGLIENKMVVSVWLLVSALLMVSRVPTFALKGWHIPRGAVVPLLVCVGLAAAGLVTDTWATLVLLVSIYICSLPIAGWYYFILAKKA